MKQLSIAALLTFLFIACAKEEDVNPPLRPPTCEDTTDDGKFEAFNSPETALFLPDSLTVPETEDADAVGYHFMSSRILRNNATIYDPSFVFKAKKPGYLMLYLPFYRNTEQIYAWVPRLVDSTDSVHIAVYNARLLNLEEGCYRLYYVYENETRTKVLTKGHYDIWVED